MRNVPPSKAPAVAAPPIVGLALMVSSALVFLAAMAPRLAAQVLFGPICGGHGSDWAPHCPACYAAVAMAALGAAILFRSVEAWRA